MHIETLYRKCADDTAQLKSAQTSRGSTVVTAGFHTIQLGFLERAVHTHPPHNMKLLERETYGK